MHNHPIRIIVHKYDSMCAGSLFSDCGGNSVSFSTLTTKIVYTCSNDWENSPGFVLVVKKLTWRTLNRNSNAEPLRSGAIAVLMPQSQRPLYTF